MLRGGPRSGESPEKALLDTDFFVLHTPFRNMPETALEKLFEHRLGFTAAQSRQFLEERGFFSAVDPLARIGNIYTGSLYTVLAFLLEDRLRAMGDRIVGKRILFASYGSGNTMMVFSGQIAREAPRVISRWNLARVFDTARAVRFEEYQRWVSGPAAPEIYARMIENAVLPPEAFFLAGVRGDGYRDYRKAEELGTWIQERATPVDLPQPVAVSG